MDLTTLTAKADDITCITNLIEIRYFKAGKSKRTYVAGLHHFMTDEEIKVLILTLKKKLGAGVDERIDESSGKKEYGFQGDHLRKMKGMIMENSNLTNAAFG